MEKYFEFVSVKANQKEHRGFLTARKEWIKQRHEGGPDRKRLKSKKELLEARKQLEVTKQVGGRFTCPKKQFVSVEALNPKKHGTWINPRWSQKISWAKMCVVAGLPRGEKDWP